MKKIFFPLAFGLLMASLLFSFSCRKKKAETSCQVNEEIPEAELDRILSAASKLIKHLEDGEIDQVYAEGTDDMKLRQNRDQFALNLELFFDEFGRFDFPIMEEAYYLTSKSKEDQVMIACNLGEEKVDDLYMAPSNQELSVVIWKARTDLEPIIRIVIMMQKVEGSWQLAQLNLSSATYNRKTYEFYLDRAVKYREENLLHLSSLYLQIVIQLSEIGQNVDEFTVRVIREQLNQLKVDYLPAGEAQIWTMPSGNSYQVYKVDPFYRQSQLLVQVSYVSNSSAQDQDRLKAEARELASFLDQLFPEYRKGFDGFLITAAFQRPEEMFLSWREIVLFKNLDHPEQGTCVVGNEIPRPELDSILAASTQLSRLIEAADWDGLWELASDPMKLKMTRDQLAFDLTQFARKFGRLEALQVDEAYLFESQFAEQEIAIPCRLGEQGAADVFRLPAGKKLAVVVFTSQGKTEKIRITLQLEKQNGGYALSRISLNPATIKNQNYSYYLDQAVKFQEQKLNYLAGLYYQTAVILSDLAPYVDEFTVQGINKELKKLKLDFFPQKGPMSWNVPDGDSFLVFQVAPAYDQGRFLVEVVCSASSQNQLEKQASMLAAFMDQELPELRKGFDGIMVTVQPEKAVPDAEPRSQIILFTELAVPGE